VFRKEHLVESTKAPATIAVTVGFPVAPHPYRDAVAPNTTVGTVRAAAMASFGIGDDPQFEYYLTHRGERQPDDHTIGQVAGHAHAVKFNLVKAIFQG
jgi:hypothetical protein